MLDNHKWRLECRKCERVKAKRFNYNAHAHSSGDRGKSDTLQFDPRPGFEIGTGLHLDVLGFK
jgi:hypothetical protein